MTLIASIITFSKKKKLEKKNVTLALDMELSTLDKKIDSWSTVDNLVLEIVLQ